MIKEEKARLGEKIQAIKDGHPVLDEAMRKSVPLLPPPFNMIAQVIYDTFDDTKKDLAIQEVLGFLNHIKKDGEDHFNQISSKLENLESSLSSLEDVTAREDTLLKIKDILDSKESSVSYRLNNILYEIRKQMISLIWNMRESLLKTILSLKMANTSRFWITCYGFPNLEA
jgi:hypothetical protein